MIRLLLLIFIVFLGVIVGRNFTGHDGQVIVITNGWSIETSISIAVCAIIVFYALLQLLEWVSINTFLMWNRTRHWFGWRKEHISQQKTLDGVVEFMSGRYEQAEKLGISHTKHSKYPLINYLTAINAAATQGKHQERDDYLQQALLLDESNMSLLCLKLRFMIEDNEFEKAQSWIDSQTSTVIQDDEILPLRLIVSKHLNDWNNVIEISDLLLKSKIHTVEVHDSIIISSYCQLLKDSIEQGVEAIKLAYNSFPKKHRNDIDIFCQYATLSIKLGESSAIEKELFQRFSKKYNNKLLMVIKVCDVKYSQQWLDKLLALKKYHENVEVMDTLATLARLTRQWKIAKDWLVKAIVIEQTAKRYELLASTQQEMGENAGALECFNKAIKLRTSKS